jgi:hypothetical protein
VNSKEPILTSPLFFETDSRIKDILAQARSVFPDGDFRDGAEFYDHAEWRLALDSTFFAVRRSTVRFPSISTKNPGRKRNRPADDSTSLSMTHRIHFHRGA